MDLLVPVSLIEPVAGVLANVQVVLEASASIIDTGAPN